MMEEKKVWKVIRIINYILLSAFVVCTAVMLSKVIAMKILPAKYIAIMITFTIIIVSLNLILRKKKAVNIIMSIVCVAMSVVYIFGYQVVNKVDEVVDKVTEGGDVQVTVMEIRVLADNTTDSMSQLEEYTIGFMKTRDRSYTNKVFDAILEEAGDTFVGKEYADDPTLLVDALYNGEVDAIIISAVYVGVLEEIEGYEDFATKTKVVEEVEIEEKIALRNEFNSQMSQTTPSTDSTEETTTNNSGSQGGSSGGHNYGQYGEWGGGFVYKEPTSAADMDKSAFVIYISGIDTYGNVNRKSRSDVNILMVVNTETKKVLLVNTPRDYYVPLSISNGVPDKLTHAGNYGVEVSRDTLGLLYGVNADYYVRMNFTGFIDVIDAMGGIDVYSEYAFTSNGLDFVSGLNTGLSGREALIFARERKQFASGDNQRGKNQMALITAMIKKAATKEVIFNYKEVLDAIAGSFQTNFTSEEIFALVKMQMNDLASWSVETYSVTGTGSRNVTFSVPSKEGYVMIPNYDTVETARGKIRAVLSGE